MIFLRHPEPDIPQGICYGRSDVGLTLLGERQIAAALRSTPALSRIIASPALRCRELAMALAGRDRIDPVFDERLWEMDMGEWEGMPWKDIPDDIMQSWIADPVNIPTPGGESFGDLKARVSEAIGEYAIGDLEGVAIVCHAGPIRAMQMIWRGITFREAFAEAPPYAEPIRLLPPLPGKGAAKGKGA